MRLHLVHGHIHSLTSDIVPSQKSAKSSQASSLDYTSSLSVPVSVVNPTCKPTLAMPLRSQRRMGCSSCWMLTGYTWLDKTFL